MYWPVFPRYPVLAKKDAKTEHNHLLQLHQVLAEGGKMFQLEVQS